VGLKTLPCKKENCREASEKFSRILWRRPRAKLGCGAKDRGRRGILRYKDAQLQFKFEITKRMKNELKSGIHTSHKYNLCIYKKIYSLCYVPLFYIQIYELIFEGGKKKQKKKKSDMSFK
jgi:hypothetical protein